MAKCKHCGKWFKPLTPTGQYCCLSCYKAGPTLLLAPAKPKKKRLLKSEHQFALYRGNTHIATGTYAQIAKETGKSVHTLTCFAAPGYKRKAKGNPNKLYLYDLTEGETIEPARQSVCLICGKEYMPTNNNQKYCSDDCAKKALAKQREDEYGLSKSEVKIKRKNDAMKSSHIEQINAKARRSGMSYGRWQAQKKLEQLHEEMMQS